MPRRAVVLLVSTVLSFVLAAATLFIPVPYAALRPGPTFDALGNVDNKPIVEISGHQQVEHPAGQLRLVTIQAYGKPQRLMLTDLLQGWLDPSIAVVPIDELFPETKSTKEQDAEGAAQMKQSQLEAKAAALAELHIPIVVLVDETDVGLPAAAILKSGDEIVAIDGTRIEALGQLTKVIGAHKPGESISITYRRAGTEHTDTIKTAASPDDANRAIIGIRPGAKIPFTLNIQLPNVGGPSAGLMFSLAIYDKLGNGQLVGDGKTIAGTGTIDGDGNVGPIGGIQQKVYAARRDGATVFLVPHANCGDVKTVPAGLQLVDVTSLADAVTDLATLRAGGTPGGCVAA